MTKRNQRLIRTHAMLTASILASASLALAQEEEQQTEDVVVVTGIRGSIAESLDAKRNTDVVSDALIGVEIGDLPDLSIAESLERITGVTSDRFKGGASEVSIRGLGAFLSYSTLNGREITSGSDGRDVNFGQFPSELFEGVQVYKSQQASFVEGGVSGTIALQTLRPLDYGKRRIQINGLAGFSDYEDRVDGGDPYSERLTVSYVDQWESSELGEFGIAIGGQIRRDTAPEDIYTSSSTWRPCNSVDGSNCSFDSMGGDSPTYFTSNQYIFRAMQTEADRDSLMANVQWRPSDRVEINADIQWSDREDLEVRHNLVIADGRRGIIPIEVSQASGALLAWQGNTRIENQSVYRPRLEEYLGGGLGAEFAVNDRLTITADLGYSKTERRQDERDMRIRTNRRVEYTVDTRGLDVPDLTFLDVSEVESNTGLTFDLDNHDIYDNGARARRRLENVDDESIALRVDGEHLLENEWLTSVEVGFRIGERQRIRDDGIDTTVSLVNGYDSAAVIATRRDRFVNDNLFEGADTPVEGITWATWDPFALYTALTGSEDAGLPTGSTLSPQDTDVTETTYAAYAQGNFASTLFDLPVSGNFGLRVVQTNVESRGVSQDFVSTASMDDPSLTVLVPVGDASVNTEENDFLSVLPSANLNFELRDDMLLRVAAYRAIARPDMEGMSAALDVNDDEDGFDINDLSDNVDASGNPFIEPLTSWNGDVSWEWYHSDDTAVSVAAYYKVLET
ncbi:MAG: TonB-dependent receptor, partial [Pseudomonadota bacterium]